MAKKKKGSKATIKDTTTTEDTTQISDTAEMKNTADALSSIEGYANPESKEPNNKSSFH